jgi:hypothetical protein
MTLHLYDTSTPLKNNVFSWAPTEKQWWITGFNGFYQFPGKQNLLMIGSIDFTGHEDMFESLKEKMSDPDNGDAREYLILDETTTTAWICW